MFRSSMEAIQFKKRINQHVFSKNREWHDTGDDSNSDEENTNAKLASVETNVEEGDRYYSPTFADILILLSNCNTSKAFLIPLNLLMEIFLYADYRPTTSSIRDQIVPGGRDQNDLHLSHPIKPMRYFTMNEIIYTVVSKDQGWSSSPDNQKGTRFGSYTWAEAAISNDAVRYEVCVNIHAGTAYEKQTKIFGIDSELYQKVQEVMISPEKVEPCELQLWIRSLYPGWANHVKYGEISVKWSPNRWEEYINSQSK